MITWVVSQNFVSEKSFVRTIDDEEELCIRVFSIFKSHERSEYSYICP